MVCVCMCVRDGLPAAVAVCMWVGVCLCFFSLCVFVLEDFFGECV